MFFRRKTKNSVIATTRNERDTRSAAVSATTPTIPPGGHLSQDQLKVAMKYRQDNGLSSGYMPDVTPGLGGFWDNIAEVAKKAQTAGKELAKVGKVATEVRRLIKPASKPGLAVTPPGQPVTVVKPATQSYDGPTSGVPLGTSTGEPTLPAMRGVDAPAPSPVNKYLMPAALGAAAVGLFVFITRRK